MNKKDIRKKMLDIRNKINENLRKQKNEKISETFIDFVLKNKFKSVLLYASFGSEVDTWQIFHLCLENSIKTAFPKVSGFQLQLYWIEKRDQFSQGYKNILEPKNGKKASVEDIEIIVVPGVAFDKRCYRIGYGGGFYDRLLSLRKGKAIGLAYEEQILEQIPTESHDIRMDMIITDERIISCV
ncbi:MAG: 5-formyltetrahydrofolate cyclo-ligase [Thermodesulfovibrio sp.]|nr:5-formyltetrahydrofolate cyclo-ligase [Thermodesulfovibrio sp.]MDW7998594.1 5-formyltetrahydrofolate cyclo-ligase [Thermodesulfovibrio sp.]